MGEQRYDQQCGVAGVLVGQAGDEVGCVVEEPVQAGCALLYEGVDGVVPAATESSSHQ